MKRKVLNKNGFTLLELIVVISIIGMVISTIFSLLYFGYDVYGRTSEDYTIQSQVKLSLEEINNMVRESRAVFAIPDTNYFDDEWNYIAVSDDKKRIESHEWKPSVSGGSHVTRVLVGPFDDVEFNIGFDKENSMSKDNTLRMYYEALTKDGTVKRFDIQSGYQALNALQVVDYGTAENKATILAYRSDDFAYENFNLIVNISMVLDVSGSMGDWLAGSTRIQILKDKSKELVQQFAQNQNDDVSINMSLIPFSYHANDPSIFYDVKKLASRNAMINKIDGLYASGNTNTGDGLRRAYHQTLNKQTSDLLNADSDTIIKNYVIILVDGQSNTHSENARLKRRGFWWLSNTWDNKTYFLDDGNVDPEDISGNTGSYYNIYYKGSGSAPGNNYVQATGALISDDEMFTNYFIAFSNSVDTNEITLIANSTNTPSDRVFLAGDDEQLGLSFTDIQLSITNDLWHFLGPKLVESEN